MENPQEYDYQSLEEELYKYGKIFMEMTPAVFMVTLTNVIARIIKEQSKDSDAKNQAILLASSHIARKVIY